MIPFKDSEALSRPETVTLTDEQRAEVQADVERRIGMTVEEFMDDHNDIASLVATIEDGLRNGANMTKANLAWNTLRDVYLGERATEFAEAIAIQFRDNDPLIFQMGMQKASAIAIRIGARGKNKVLQHQADKIAKAIQAEAAAVVEVPEPEEVKIEALSGPNDDGNWGHYVTLGDIAESVRRMKADGISVQSIMYVLGRVYGAEEWTELAKITVELDNAIADYRRSFPAPQPLAPNLQIAYDLMKIMRTGYSDE